VSGAHAAPALPAAPTTGAHTRTRLGWGAAGTAAIILATFLGGGWAICLVLGSLPSTPEQNHDTATLLNGIGQVLAGAIATFLGSQIPSRNTTTITPAKPAESEGNTND
jgi:hypothetical protein